MPFQVVVWFGLGGGGGFIGAIVIGLVFHRMKSTQVLIQKPLKDTMPQVAKRIGGLAPRALAQNVIVSHFDSSPKSKSGDEDPLIFWKSKGIAILNHTQHELFDVGRYLILGAFVSASMQVFVPRGWLLALGGNPFLSTLAMMALAFVLSLCSEADAFVASTFRYQFSEASLFAFLVFGPMIDIKNTLMLAGGTQRTFVVKLIATIVLVCLMMALCVAFGGLIISTISSM